MSKPMPAEAQAVFERSGERYAEHFDNTAGYDAHVDGTTVSISLHKTDDESSIKSVELRFEFALFAEILRDLAKAMSSVSASDGAHRDALREGAKALYQELDERRNDRKDLSQMTAEDEVLLLHVME